MPILERFSTSLDAGFSKLQVLLLEMVPGGQLSVDRAVELTGLDKDTCAFVLDALTAAGLMIPGPRATYVRCRLQLTKD